MGMSGVFIRFAVAYVVLSIGLTVGLALMKVMPNSGITVAVLLGAVMWPGMTFAQKNGRYFTADEKWRVVMGMLLIDLLLQLVIATPQLGALRKLPLGAMLGGAAFIAVLHAAVLYFAVALTGKFLVKDYINNFQGSAQ